MKNIMRGHRMDIENIEQMMYLYGNIKVICTAGLAVCFLASVLVFFIMKIPSVFGALTGRTARRAIKKMIEKSIVEIHRDKIM